MWLAVIPSVEISGNLLVKLIFFTIDIDYLTFFFFLTLQVLYTAKSQELSYIVKGLKPYRIYNFTISLCNSVGCVTSASEAGQTLASGKQVLADVKNILYVYKENTYKAQ